MGGCELDWSATRSMGGYELDWSDARSVGWHEPDWADIFWNLFIILTFSFQLLFIISSSLSCRLSSRFIFLAWLATDFCSSSVSRFIFLAWLATDFCSSSVIHAWSLALSLVFALAMMSCSSDLLTFC
jgi:hypothetical protein